MELTINGTRVNAREGTTILEAARSNGVVIPTLCHVPELTPAGACRLCVVEVQGSRLLVGSCYTPVTEGMVVQTHSPKVLETRKILVELMMASHPDSCIVCNKANQCELRRIAMELDIGLPRFQLRKHYYPIENGNPSLIRDMSKCILCRRCVLACREVSGKQMFSIAYRGFDSKVVHGLDQPVPADSCKDCDTCVSLCPTGALSKASASAVREPKKALFIRGC